MDYFLPRRWIWRFYDPNQLLCSQNPSVSFNGVLSISVLNSYYNKKKRKTKKKKKTGVSLQATLQSTLVAFEVIACQYLGATDRQQSHLCIIPPFHLSTAEQIGGEEKIEIQNKTC